MSYPLIKVAKMWQDVLRCIYKGRDNINQQLSQQNMIKLIKTGSIYTNAKWCNIKPKEKYETAFIALTIIAFALAYLLAGTSDYQTMIGY